MTFDIQIVENEHGYTQERTLMLNKIAEENISDKELSKISEELMERNKFVYSELAK